MAVVPIQESDLVRKDPADSKTYCFDWDWANLAPNIQISNSTFSLTEVQPVAAWSSTVTYRAGDQVLQTGVIYSARVAHLNQPVSDANYWTAVIADTPLTKDSEATLTAAQATTALQRSVTVDNRVTRLRLLNGTLGHVYVIANKITSTETPPQIKERSFRVLIEDQ